MRVIILAGGLPSTLIEEDEKMPKPMAEIGGRPLLWHIMKQYAHYGYNDFLICTGYKGEVIKDYFMNFYIYQSDITVDLTTNDVVVHRKQTEDWRVTIIDTGQDSTVIERMHMAGEIVGTERALVTYGDCLSDIDIGRMVAQHESSDAAATFAVAHPAGRNEVLSLERDGTYQGCRREPPADSAWVNACSMVLEPRAFRYFSPDVPHAGPALADCIALSDKVMAYRHEGFWTPVETARDKELMERLWADKRAPWAVWDPCMSHGY